MEFARTAEPRLRYALVARYGADRGREVANDALVHGWRHWERVQGMANLASHLERAITITSAYPADLRDACASWNWPCRDRVLAGPTTRRLPSSRVLRRRSGPWSSGGLLAVSTALASTRRLAIATDPPAGSVLVEDEVVRVLVSAGPTRSAATESLGEWFESSLPCCGSAGYVRDLLWDGEQFLALARHPGDA